MKVYKTFFLSDQSYFLRTNAPAKRINTTQRTLSQQFLFKLINRVSAV